MTTESRREGGDEDEVEAKASVLGKVVVVGEEGPGGGDWVRMEMTVDVDKVGAADELVEVVAFCGRAARRDEAFGSVGVTVKAVVESGSDIEVANPNEGLRFELLDILEH